MTSKSIIKVVIINIFVKQRTSNSWNQNRNYILNPLVLIFTVQLIDKFVLWKLPLEHEFSSMVNVIIYTKVVFTNEGQNVKSIGNKQKHGIMDDLSDTFSKKRLERHQMTSISLLWERRCNGVFMRVLPVS